MAPASHQMGETVLDHLTPAKPQLIGEISSTEGETKAYHDRQKLALSRTLIGSLAGCKEGYKGPDYQMAFWGREETRQAAPSLSPTATVTQIQDFSLLKGFLPKHPQLFFDHLPALLKARSEPSRGISPPQKGRRGLILYLTLPSLPKSVPPNCLLVTTLLQFSRRREIGT